MLFPTRTIGVAVMAFKAAVSLELKRRDNDQRVAVLRVKMQDLMEVFVQYVFFSFFTSGVLSAWLDWAQFRQSRELENKGLLSGIGSRASAGRLRMISSHVVIFAMRISRNE